MLCCLNPPSIRGVIVSSTQANSRRSVGVIALAALIGIGLLTLTGCGGGESLGPSVGSRLPGRVDAAIIRSAAGCATMNVTIDNQGTVAATFPSPALCGTSLSLLGAGAATYTKSAHQLTLPVRVRNSSADTVRPPVVMGLPAESGVVTAPAKVGGPV